MTGAIVRRSYATGSQSLSRLIQGDTRAVEVVFRPGSDLPREVVVDFERQSDGRSTSVPLKSVDHTFSGAFTADACGLLRAKTRFRFGNESWITDNTAYAYFLVDPRNAMSTRMYTLFPCCNGTIGEDWLKLLPQVADLGCNTIHLLPITAMGPSSSPYAASDLMQIDPGYTKAENPAARMQEFRDFVAACKDHGIRLCVDLVFNHLALNGSVARSHVDWLSEDATEPDGIKRSGWHDGHRWHKWEDLAFLNYRGFSESSREDLWRYMTDYGLFWSSFAAETGGMIRLDNLHSSTPEFMRHTLQIIRREYPDITVLAELFTSPEETVHLTYMYGINFLLATTWEHKFVPQLRRYLGFLHNGSPSLRYFSPVTSHDSGTPAQEFGSVLSTVPRLVMSTLMGPGPSGIVQGVENGLIEKVPWIGPPKRHDFGSDGKYSGLIRRLNSLLEGFPQLTEPGNISFIDGDHEAILAVVRKSADGSILVCANFDTVEDQQILLPPEVAEKCAKKNLVNELSGTSFRELLDGYLLTLPAAGCAAVVLD